MKFNTLSYTSKDIGLRGNYNMIISKYAFLCKFMKSYV